MSEEGQEEQDEKRNGSIVATSLHSFTSFNLLWSALTRVTHSAGR